MEYVKETYLAVSQKQEDGKAYFSVCKDPEFAPVQCYANLISESVKDKDTKPVIFYVYKIYTYDPDNITGFNPELIHYDSTNGLVVPGTTAAKKLGTALVSLKSPEGPVRSYAFNVQYFPVQKVINDIAAN